ncbi:hypothetical protein HUJ04_008145 [Dendroctonus ponderosae]|nr:hypothetical protein HUJ04_008145 [Dendroctonus ponderosae]
MVMLRKSGRTLITEGLDAPCLPPRPYVLPPPPPPPPPPPSSEGADAEINQSTFEAGRNRIMEMSRTCDENPATAVDQKALEKYLESNGPDPANAGVHALCITKNLSWQNEDGSVNKSLITEKVKAIFGGVDAKIERYIEDCTEAKAKPEDTAEQLLNCYRKHSPKTE